VSVWLNDRDPNVVALWEAVINSPEELKRLVIGFEPSKEKFSQFRTELSSASLSHVERAFKFLAVHQMSFSGLGMMAGGPMRAVGCRWSRDNICKKIDSLPHLFTRANVTCGDFEPLLDGDCIIYLDPPYFEKGHQLYRFAFTEQDHIRLADRLRQLPDNWLLSYDDCPAIRDMYGWAAIKMVEANYTINTVRRKCELLIARSFTPEEIVTDLSAFFVPCDQVNQSLAA
jgi:DNA adenine methylase